MEPSTIAEFYRGKSVLVTGGTGFLGKVLIEKLLRSCPDIAAVYLLMRPKSGQEVESRLQQLIKLPVFDQLKKEKFEQLNKLKALSGDICLPGLGLSPSDLLILCDHVSVVFNLAATIRFDEQLGKAVDMNVKGVRRILELCRHIKNLESLVHVSTTYVHLEREVIEEVVYPTAISQERLFTMVDCLEDEQLNLITKSLLGSCPNTYAYTKAYGEQLLQMEHGSIPSCIVRPSIVTASMKEPKPGWIDNINGPTCLVVGSGKGFLRTGRVFGELEVNLIPVDFPVNLMIAAAWQTANLIDPQKIDVYNCGSSSHNPVTWGKFKDKVIENWLKYPTLDMMWHPSAHYERNITLNHIYTFLYHTLPAHLLDFLAMITGKTPQLVKIYSKANRMLDSLTFFGLHQWRFISENPSKLFNQLSVQDRGTFYFDVSDINWDQYFTNYVLGVRQYLLNDDASTLPAARQKLKRLNILRNVFLPAVVVFFLICLQLFCNAFWW